MTHSQIQQDIFNSEQVYILNQTAAQQLEDIIHGLKEAHESPAISTTQKTDLNAEIKTIKEQLSSSKPKIMIIKESLSSAKNILKNFFTVCFCSATDTQNLFMDKRFGIKSP
jgi:hypothetical protein